MISTKKLDVMAMGSSLLCAIHCAVIPVLLYSSTFAGLAFLHEHWVEWVFIALAFVFVLVALLPSYRKKHKSVAPLVIVSIGFLFIVISRFPTTETEEIITTTMGSLIICGAHYINWKMNRECTLHK